jgi:bifunctional non-homologous end joining protein LigD
MNQRIMLLDRHRIEVTHEDKILFPKIGLTKRDLIDYYVSISPIMLPYLHNRPLTLHRFVEGVGSEGFYQKDASDYFPSWIKRIAIPKKSGTTHYVMANNAATLAYLTNQLTIEYHPWLSRADKLHQPDRMIFDLDPAGKANFKLVVWAACVIKEFLETLGLPAFVMTTGSRGLHVLVPLKRVHTFEVVRAFSRTVGACLAAQFPKKMTIAMRLADRGNAIFIDILRNGFTATAIAPYAVRARENASVATPLHWKELRDGTVSSSAQFTIQTIGKRLAHMKDPWLDMQKQAVTLTAARKKLDIKMACQSFLKEMPGAVKKGL